MDMTSLSRAALINNRLLRHLDSAGLDRVASVAVKHSYKPGTYIFSSGDPGDGIFGVISGQVHITARSPNHQEIFLDVVQPNDAFGTTSVVDGLPRCVSARAATCVDAFMICRSNFTRLMLTDHNLALGLIDALCRHQRLSMRVIVGEYAQGNIPARLAHRLLELTAAGGIGPGGCPLLTITQEELAKFVFVSRQVVNQHLSDWQSRGWISASRRRLVVNDRDALAELVRSGGNGSKRNGVAPQSPATSVESS